MSYIGIDIGASFIKGAILDLDKLSITSIIKYKSPNSISYSDNRFEINPDEFEKIVIKIINKLLNANRSIEGIVLCSQMHGMLLVNSKIESVTNFIGWQDGRANEIAFKNVSWLDLINKKLKNVDIANTGIRFRVGIMGSTLFWLKETGVLKTGEHKTAMFLGDYIAAKLSNGLLVTHPTNACGSGLFNTKNNVWDKRVLKHLGISEHSLPKVVSTGTRVGNFNKKNKNIPVFVSTGDMQASVLGSLVGLGKEKEFSINIGTGSQISTISKKFKKGDFDVRAYFDGQFLLTKTHLPAGRALNTLIRFVEEIGKKVFGARGEVWEKLINLASETENKENLAVDVSFFKGNGMNKESGHILNITESNFTIGNVFHGALINMVNNYLYWFSKLGGKRKDTIILSGGLVRKFPLLVTLIKKIFYTNKVKLSENEEETLAGLFILALFSSNLFPSIKKASVFIKNNKLLFE